METPARYGQFLSLVYVAGSKLTLHGRYINQFLEQVDLEITSKSKVLDAGCGGGRLAVGLILSQRKKSIDLIVDAFDLSEPMLRKAERYAEKRKARENLKLYQADGRNLSAAKEFYNGKTNGKTITFADSQYDVLLCSGMLECLPQQDTAKAAEEIIRVLKPGGKFVFSFVKNNKLGKIACGMLRFKIIPKEEIFCEFYKNGIRNFEEFHVKSLHPYMKKLTGIYVGTKE